jgi:hypothetical protein
MTIPKSKRHLSEVKVDNMVGPSSYQKIKLASFISNSGNQVSGSMSKEQRDYDPIKYGANNLVLLVKGIH